MRLFLGVGTIEWSNCPEQAELILVLDCCGAVGRQAVRHQAEAETWFSIVPGGEGKVVEMRNEA